MDEGIITEVIMIIVVLAIGFTLIVTLTPFLRSFTAPQAAPLAEVVYTYSQKFNNGTYLWEGYLYIYDNNPVDLYSITIFSSSAINVNRVVIVNPDNVSTTYTTTDVNLRLTRGLYTIKVYFTSNANLNSVGYVLALTGGHTLEGETSVITV